MQSSAVASAVPSVLSAPQGHEPVAHAAKRYSGWYRHQSGAMVEGSTGDVYNDDATSTIRSKCAALAVANPFINAVNLGETLWWRTRKGCGHIRHGRIGRGMGNLGMAVASPVLWAGMEGAALVGLAAPLHGRKWWGRMESHMAWELAPCFQPLQPGGGEPLSAEELKERGYKQHRLGIQIGRARW